MAEDELKVKFTDEVSAKLGKIASGFSDVQVKAVKAQIAADTFSKKMRATPVGFAEATKTWGPSTAALGSAVSDAPAKKVARAMAGTEMTMRDEMRARRERVKSLKFEEQKGNLAGSAVGAVAQASHLFGVEANSLTDKAGAAVGGFESLGFQMAAFGGRLGSIGSKIVGLAGPVGLIAAAGGLIYEGGKYIASKLDKTAEKEEERAKYLGFRNAIDKKAFDEARQTEKQRKSLLYLAGRQAEQMGAEPGAGARLDEREAWEKKRTQALQALTKSGFSMEASMNALDAATEGSYETTKRRSMDEARLAAAEREALAGLELLPLNANAEQVKAHSEAAKEAARQLFLSNKIYEQERDSVTNALIARSEVEGSIHSMVARNTTLANEEARMEDAMRQFAKTLPHIPANATFNQMTKLNSAIERSTELFAEGEKTQGRTLSPEQIKAFQLGLLQRARSPVINFNNPRFDIRQNFAEGFDPDRIAVAFTRDIVALGETRLQSGLAPIYSGR